MVFLRPSATENAEVRRGEAEFALAGVKGRRVRILKTGRGVLGRPKAFHPKKCSSRQGLRFSSVGQLSFCRGDSVWRVRGGFLEH